MVQFPGLIFERIPMPKPEPQGEPQERAEVKKFKSDYEEAIAKAKVSEELTAALGWQDLYGEHREAIRRRQEAIAAKLGGIVEAAQARLLVEDEEKSLADIKKESADARQVADYFQSQVIDPIMAPLHECNRVIEAGRTAARNAEKAAPLHTRGLADAMEAAIEGVAKPKWMIASGKLIVG